MSVDQRSNARYERTNDSSHMFSQSCTWPAMRVAGRSISNEVKIISEGTLPVASTSRSTSK